MGPLRAGARDPPRRSAHARPPADRRVPAGPERVGARSASGPPPRPRMQTHRLPSSGEDSWFSVTTPIPRSAAPGNRALAAAAGGRRWGAPCWPRPRRAVRVTAAAAGGADGLRQPRGGGGPAPKPRRPRSERPKRRR